MSRFLTTEQIRAASAALGEARRSFDCQAPRTDADGKAAAERRGKSVPYGTHGSAFLQIDPETLEVRCGACVGEMDATAAQKIKVDGRGGRVHFVTESAKT